MERMVWLAYFCVLLVNRVQKSTGTIYSFGLQFECLRQTQTNKYVDISQIHWIRSVGLYRKFRKIIFEQMIFCFIEYK